MRFLLFIIAIFVTVCLLGAPADNPFPNFGAVIILWLMYYLLTAPGRRRHRLEDEYMRTYLYNNSYCR